MELPSHILISLHVAPGGPVCVVDDIIFKVSMPHVAGRSKGYDNHTALKDIKLP
jgi:hypothetical protein